MGIDHMEILGPLAITTMFFIVLGALLALVAIGMALFGVVDKADKHLAPLAHKNDPFFKLFPACGGRLAWYGLAVLLRGCRSEEKWPFANRPDRLQAIDNSPKWIKASMVFVYFGFLFSILLALIFGGGMMFLDGMSS